MSTRSYKKSKWLGDRIKKNWPQLSDEEIALYHERPEAFYDAVKKRYGMFRGDVETSLRKLNSCRSWFRWWN